jgi:hypothetical protein
LAGILALFFKEAAGNFSWITVVATARDLL